MIPQPDGGVSGNLLYHSHTLRGNLRHPSQRPNVRQHHVVVEHETENRYHGHGGRSANGGSKNKTPMRAVISVVEKEGVPARSGRVQDGDEQLRCEGKEKPYAFYDVID